MKRGDKTTTAHRNKVRALLQKHGASASKAQTLTPSNATAGETAEAIKGFLRTAPKQKP